MAPLPLFTRDKPGAAFRLVLPPDVADRCAREWFDQFASESVDQRGYFLYKEWWDQSGAPAARARGLVVQTASVTDAERDAHERKFFGSFFFSSRRRHTMCGRDWSSDVCSSDLTLTDSLLMGGAQVIGLLPGISRSGVTSSFGVSNRLSLLSALRFSFMMYIPASLGALLIGADRKSVV